MAETTTVPTATMATTYHGKVAQENGRTILVFPAKMLEQLGWSEGDSIVWDIREDAVVARQANDNDV
jgi:bifunctional DNA-binding transcriptional regulator/antitoxin component of YhaV-PrlF toxin-antitoxin module